tara:strand:- start:1841 stop:2068 length:228 start_codon:yes stop_codon:yes gene_type:complete
VATKGVNMLGKSKEIEEMLEKFSSRFSMSRSVAMSNSKCVMCGGDATEFRNEVSKKEYQISKMCQSCQDSVFGVE